MTTKRGLDVDPDYEDVTVNPTHQKRQRIIEQDGKEATVNKIGTIITQQFTQELHRKEQEVEEIDKTLQQSRFLLDKLRACIVAKYYANPAQQSVTQGKSSVQTPSIHPAVKKFLGKTPRNVTSNTSSLSTVVEASCSTSHINDVTQTDTKCTSTSANSLSEMKSSVPDLQEVRNRSSIWKIKKRVIVGNISRYIPFDKRDEQDQATHKWMVYVRGSKHEPNIDHYVKKVLFFLHPSYRPNDLVEIRKSPFHLTRRGWGEFPVRVQLHFQDSRNKPVDIIHNLKLDRTYTGLQTLGSETLVDIELEKDTNNLPKKTKQNKEKGQQVTPDKGHGQKVICPDKGQHIVTPGDVVIGGPCDKEVNTSQLHEDSIGKLKSIKQEISEMTDIVKIPNCVADTFKSPNSPGRASPRRSNSTAQSPKSPQGALLSRTKLITPTSVTNKPEIVQASDINNTTMQYASSKVLHTENAVESQVLASPIKQLCNLNQAIAATSNKTSPSKTSPSQIVGPAGNPVVISPNTVFVRCVDGQGRVFLVPPHMLSKTPNAAGKLSITNPTVVKSSTQQKTLSTSLPVSVTSPINATANPLGAKKIDKLDSGHSKVQISQAGSPFVISGLSLNESGSVRRKSGSHVPGHVTPTIQSARMPISVAGNRQVCASPKQVSSKPASLASTTPNRLTSSHILPPVLPVKIANQSATGTKDIASPLQLKSLLKSDALMNMNIKKEFPSNIPNTAIIPLLSGLPSSDSHLGRLTPKPCSTTTTPSIKAPVTSVMSSPVQQPLLTTTIGNQTYILRMLPDQQSLLSSSNQIVLLPNKLANQIKGGSDTTRLNTSITKTPSKTESVPTMEARDQNVLSKVDAKNKMHAHLHPTVFHRLTNAQESPSATLSLSHINSMECLIKKMIRQHPLVSKTADRNLHPYCTRSKEDFLSWNIGKRRAAEWQRCVWARRKMVHLLQGESEYAGERVWSVKKMALWCRHHCYTPVVDGITSSTQCQTPRPMPLPKHSTFTDIDKINHQLDDITDGSHDSGTDSDIDIIAVDERKVCVKKEITETTVKEEMNQSCINIESSPFIQWIAETVQQIGISARLQELVSGTLCHGVEEVLQASLHQLLDDILRTSVASVSQQMGRIPEEIGESDVFRAISQLPHCDFMTNSHIGIKHS